MLRTIVQAAIGFVLFAFFAAYPPVKHPVSEHGRTKPGETLKIPLILDEAIAGTKLRKKL